jgi:hypothetical protein
MIHKLTQRSRLQNSEWLSQVKQQAWNVVQKPASDGLGVQATDLTRPIDGDSAARRIREQFHTLVNRGVQPVPSDGEMASAIHRIMDGITHREASDPEIWAYLVSFGCPEYPRWRWPQPNADLKNRYAGSIRRNAFAALWWWAEVTHDPEKQLDDPDRYAETRIVEGRTSFVLYCIDCAFAGHRLLVHSLSRLQQRQALSDRASYKLCRSVNRMARTICLDSLSSQDQVASFGQRAHDLSAQLA